MISLNLYQNRPRFVGLFETVTGLFEPQCSYDTFCAWALWSFDFWSIDLKIVVVVAHLLRPIGNISTNVGISVLELQACTGQTGGQTDVKQRAKRPSADGRLTVVVNYTWDDDCINVAGQSSANCDWRGYGWRRKTVRSELVAGPLNVLTAISRCRDGGNMATPLWRRRRRLRQRTSVELLSQSSRPLNMQRRSQKHTHCHWVLCLCLSQVEWVRDVSTFATWVRRSSACVTVCLFVCLSAW